MTHDNQTAAFREKLDQLTPDQLALVTAFLDGLLAQPGSTAGS